MAGAGRAVDPRVQRSREAVLAETYRQLSRSGLAGVSIDEVSRASGVAKTTIYRHWPTRSALLIEACSRLSGTHEAPDTGSLHGDVRVLAVGLATQLRTAAWSSAYPSIIDAAERDADIAALQIQWHRSLMVPFDAVAERARARGEMRPDRSAGGLTAATVGPLFYRRWFSREPLDDGFVADVVDAAVATASHSRPA